MHLLVVLLLSFSIPTHAQLFGSESSTPEGRNNRVEGAFSYYDQTIDEEGDQVDKDKVLSFSVDYGFVHSGILEYGPELTFVSTKDDSGSDALDIRIGGFLEYNFVPNVQGQISVPFVGAGLGLGQGDDDGYDYDVKYYKVYGGFRYFPQGISFGLVGTVEYKITDVDYSDDTEYEYKRTTASFGLVNYF